MKKSLITLAALVGLGCGDNPIKSEETKLTHTLSFTEFSGQVAFYGLVFNYGERDVRVKPIVSFVDSAGQKDIVGKLYRNFSRSTGPYLEDPILNVGEELTFVTDIVPYSKGIRQKSLKVDFKEY